MDILNKAMELGEMIAGSNELKRLKESEIRLDTDEHAKALMNDFKTLQIELVKATKSGLDKISLDEIRDRLIRKQSELNEYETTNEYFEAKSGFDKLMKNINNVLTYAITGEEPCSSDKCSTCGGCS